MGTIGVVNELYLVGRNNEYRESYNQLAALEDMDAFKLDCYGLSGYNQVCSTSSFYDQTKKLP